MQCKFVIGQAVVCVLHGNWTHDARYPMPKQGEVCTVVGMHPGAVGGIVCPSEVWLELQGKGGYYCSGQFRPARMNKGLSKLEWAMKNPNAPIFDIEEIRI